jgi:hypothetical protein
MAIKPSKVWVDLFKGKKTNKYLSLFLLIFLSNFALTFLFTVSFIERPWIIYLYFVISGLTLAFFVITSKMDSGNLPNLQGKKYGELL